MFQRIRYYLRELNWLAVAAVVTSVLAVVVAFIARDLSFAMALGLAGITCAILAKDA
jgi:hypothetical protein